MDKVTTKVYEIHRAPLSIRRAAGITVWAEPVSSLTLTASGKMMSSKLVVSIADSTGTVNAKNFKSTLAIIINAW